jgi:hypothetical protein
MRPLFGRRRRARPTLLLRITVWWEDIEGAVRGSAARNPLALAMVRQLNIAQARVTDAAATLVWASPRTDVEVAPLPLSARLFLVRFEARVPVRPFTFRLRVEAHPDGMPAPSLELGLPPVARAAAGRIRGRAEALLGRAEEFPVGSRDLFVAGRMLDTYLPEAIAGYVALSERQRGEPITGDGRSGRQVLMHELELMEGKLAAIAAELDRARAARLLAQERFLEDQLGGDEDRR